LRPASDLAASVAAIRTDLAEIGRQINEALPRHAVESLEREVKALAERIDQSRQTGRDSNALAGLERGLAEVHEALRALTPAESLVGFEEAVHALSQKLDIILARDDPSALQQLDAAIGSLRAVVSHVASNDSVTRVAEDVRALAAQIDGIANNPATGAVLALEQRLDALDAALQASSEAGHAVPGDLEKLLSGLIEKLEWVQLTHTDHAVLGHVEERIAALVQRLDASDAQLGHLEAIERGLTDLLVRLEQLREVNGPTAVGATPEAPAAMEREVAEIKENERRTRDSLAAVQGAVEQVIDRLSTLEHDLHTDVAADTAQQSETAAAAQEPPTAYRAAAFDSGAVSSFASEAAPPSAGAAGSGAARPPIDRTLPPDHPLEPGSAAGSRPSAADRIAASEAAIGAVKPPVIADSGRPDFIAAARRAAQAAAWESGPPAKNGTRTDTAAQPNTHSQRLHKLIVAGAALLLLVGGLRIATVLIGDAGSPGAAPAKSQPSPPPGAAPQAARPTTPPTSAPSSAPPSRSESAPPGAPAAAQEGKTGRQSMAPHAGAQPVLGPVLPPAADQPGATAMLTWGLPDLSGAVPSAPAPSLAPSSDSTTGATSGDENKLPATIGTAALRKAAMAGDPAAAYEVAIRFADGHDVAQNYEAAAYWLQRAAKAGLAPAQLRLGALYESGLGVKKDLATAHDLYLAAAEKGNGKAMHNLAVLYAEGVGGTPDYRSAAAWFRKAADHGIRDSQYNLGILYARGIGVEQNNAESYKWFALAAEQGDTDAAKKRDAIASRLNAQSLAAARLAVKNWSAEPQPAQAVTVKISAAWGAPAKARVAARQNH
jgi:localization factor PodJL